MRKLIYSQCSLPDTQGQFEKINHYYIGNKNTEQEILAGLAKCDIYKFPTDQLLDQYCEGMTLVTVKHDGTGGLKISETQNSYACGFQSVISITELQVTHETAALLNDGTVKAIVSTNSNHALQYSLDGFYTWQYSNYFQNLAPGPYIMYVRDEEQTTSDSMPFVINPGPSGNPRYFSSYYDDLNRFTENKIFKKGYNGESEELTMDGNPVIFNVAGRGEDVYHAVKTKSAQLNIIAFRDFQFNEFFLGDERNYRYEQYKEGKLTYKGYILPDVYQEPYMHPPFAVSISATDGLQLLQYYPFAFDTGSRLTVDKSFKDLLIIILDKLDLSLPLVTMVNKYELNMPQGPEYDPLALAQCSPTAFMKDGKPMNCLEALQTILHAWNSRIYQSGGKWYVVRVNELDRERWFREYDHYGTMIASGEAGNFKTITKAPDGPVQYPIGVDRIFWVEARQQLTYKPACKRVITTYHGNGSYNHLPDGSFEEEAWRENGTLWSWDGSAKYERTETGSPSSTMLLEGGKYDLRLIGHSDTIQYATLLRSLPFNMDRRLEVSGWFLIECEDEYDVLTKTNPQLYCEIKCGDYYFNGGSWGTDQVFFNLIPVGATKFNEYIHIRLYGMPAPPVPAPCTVRLTQCVTAHYNVLAVRLNGLEFYEAETSISYEAFHKERIYKEESPKNYTEEHNSVIYLGDAVYNTQVGLTPDEIREGASYFRMNGSIRYNGSVKLLWREGREYQSNLNIPIDFSFVRKHSMDRYKNVSQPRQILNGALRGVLDMGTVLADISNPGRLFLPTGYSLNDKDCTYDGEWIEIWSKDEFGHLINYEGGYAVDYEGKRVRNYRY